MGRRPYTIVVQKRMEPEDKARFTVDASRGYMYSFLLQISVGLYSMEYWQYFLSKSAVNMKCCLARLWRICTSHPHRGFRRSTSLGPLLGPLSQFHAWWHVLAGMGTYLHIVLRYMYIPMYSTMMPFLHIQFSGTDGIPPAHNKDKSKPPPLNTWLITDHCTHTESCFPFSLHTYVNANNIIIPLALPLAFSRCSFKTASQHKHGNVIVIPISVCSSVCMLPIPGSIQIHST